MLAATASLSAQSAPAPDTRVYELRTYVAHDGKLPNVLARFRDHTTALFTKHGMVNVGYFVPLDSADGAGSTLVYVVAHASRAAADASWKAFGADPAWKTVAQTSEAAGPIVKRIDRVFLSAANFSPALASASARAQGEPRTFELRTYTATDGRLSALDTRFRDHTLGLFARHGMTSIMYWHPMDDQPGAARTLTYLLAYPSRSAAVASWSAFRADPTWVAARTASEQAAGGSLTTSVKSVFLVPTDFSTLR